MLWPGTPDDPIQIIDVRDFANFAVDCAEQKIAGTYNAATPAGSFTMGQLLDDCLAVTAADMTPITVDGGWLDRQDLAQGRSIPIWAPPVGDFAGLPFTNSEKAVARGLHNRPPRETTRDTIRWWASLPAERQTSMKAGLSAEGEVELLRKWKKANG